MNTGGTDLRRIEARIAAVDAVGGVVHALWALARSQQAQVDALALGAGAYLDWVDDLVVRIAGTLTPGEGEDVLTVLLGPQRSFCGGLPREIARHLDLRLRHGLVGDRLAEAVVADRRGPPQVAFQIPGPSGVHEIEEVTEAVAERVLAHAKGAPVVLLHPRAEARGLTTVVLLAGARRRGPTDDFESYSPVDRLLDLAVAESVVGRIRVALTDTLRAEVRARVLAAQHARETVDRQRQSLADTQRVLLQETITTELCELMASRLR